MRHIKQISALLLLVAIIGCATNRKVYNTLAAVDAVTTSAVSAYFEAVAKKQAPISGVPNVARAFDNYKVVFSAAVAAARFNTNVIAPPIVTDASTQVINTISEEKWSIK